MWCCLVGLFLGMVPAWFLGAALTGNWMIATLFAVLPFGFALMIRKDVRKCVNCHTILPDEIG